MLSLEKKNIIITGASSGIGRQTAIECNRAGANLYLIGRNEDRLKLLIEEMQGINYYRIFDVTDYNNIKNVVNSAFEKLGNIDGFVHSAGIELTKPFSLTRPEEYELLYRTNVVSGFEFAKNISAKKIINEKGGSFIFIASVLGIVSKPGIISYSASKGALISGVKSMALELALKKIRVNSISPAVVETELTKSFIEKLPDEARKEMINMHPLGLGKPEDVANTCIFLLSDAAKWITGANFIIDGGYSAK